MCFKLNNWGTKSETLINCVVCQLVCFIGYVCFCSIFLSTLLSWICISYLIWTQENVLRIVRGYSSALFRVSQTHLISCVCRWHAIIVDGHSVEELCKALCQPYDQPTVIVAQTLKGKGISGITHTYRKRDGERERVYMCTENTVYIYILMSNMNYT